MSRPNFFSSGSPFLDHPLLTPERTAKEIDFVLAQTRLSKDGRILDVGCGPGRHSIELALRGYQVTGIDPSPAMIAAARQRAQAAGVQPQFRQTAGEAFSPEEKFEAAICLFTTLGQINSGVIRPPSLEDPLLKQIAAVLTPGGILILEVPQKDWVIQNLKASDRFGDHDRYTDVRRSYDPANSIITENFKLVSPEGVREYLLRYYIYDLNDLRAMLENGGFEMVQHYGDFDQNPLTPASQNIIAVGRARP